MIRAGGFCFHKGSKNFVPRNNKAAILLLDNQKVGQNVGITTTTTTARSLLLHSEDYQRFHNSSSSLLVQPSSRVSGSSSSSSSFSPNLPLRTSAGEVGYNPTTTKRYFNTTSINPTSDTSKEGNSGNNGDGDAKITELVKKGKFYDAYQELLPKIQGGGGGGNSSEEEVIDVQAKISLLAKEGKFQDAYEVLQDFVTTANNSNNPQQQQQQQQPNSDRGSGSSSAEFIHHDVQTEQKLSELVNQQQFHDAYRVLQNFANNSNATTAQPTKINTGFIFKLVYRIAGEVGKDNSHNMMMQQHHPQDAIPLPVLAEKVLDLEQQLDSQNRLHRSSHGLYRFVIMAWANSKGLPQSGERAEAVLLAHQSERDPRDRPTVVDYNNVMKAYLNNLKPTTNNEQDKNHNQQIYSKLEEISRTMPCLPDEMTYNLLSQVYVKTGNTTKMEILVQQYQNQYQNNQNNHNHNHQNKPPGNTLIFLHSNLLNTYANAGDPHGAEQALYKILSKLPPQQQQETRSSPRVSTNVGIQYVNIVLKAWMKSNEPDRYDKAMEILDDIAIRHSRHEINFGLDRISYHTIMFKYAHDGMAKEATKLYEKLLQNHPPSELSQLLDTAFFNSWMKSLAHMAASNAGRQADMLLQEMTKYSHFLKPDAFTYRAAFQCWQKQLQTDSNFDWVNNKRLRELKRLIHLAEVEEREAGGSGRGRGAGRRNRNRGGRNRGSRRNSPNPQGPPRGGGDEDGGGDGGRSTHNNNSNHHQRSNNNNNQQPGGGGKRYFSSFSQEHLSPPPLSPSSSLLWWSTESDGRIRDFSYDDSQQQQQRPLSSLSTEGGGELQPPPLPPQKNNRRGNNNNNKRIEFNTIEKKIHNLTRQGKLEDAIQIVEQNIIQSSSTKNNDNNDNDDHKQEPKRPLIISQQVLTPIFEKLEQEAAKNKSNSTQNAALLAEKLLDLEFQLRKSGQTKGILRHHSNVIKTWMHYTDDQNQQDSAYRAEATLQKAIDYATTTKDPRDRPISQDYNSIMSMYSYHYQPHKAEAVLLKMIQMAGGATGVARPDERSYTIVINAYIKAGKLDDSKVTELMRQYVEKKQGGGGLETQQANDILYSLSKVAAATDANNNQGAIIDRMEEIYALLQRPDAYSYSHRLNTYANARDPHGAEEAFRDITLKAHQNPEVYPPVTIPNLNAVLKAWVQSDEPDKFDRALEIMDDVQERQKSGIIDLGGGGGGGGGLDIVSYRTLMGQYAQEGLAEDATKLYQRMLVDYHQGGNTAAKPDTIDFNLWLKSFRTSGGGRSGKAGEQAEIVLKEMKEHNIQPDRITYESVLHCWRVQLEKTKGRRSKEIYQRMEELQQLRNQLT